MSKSTILTADHVSALNTLSNFLAHPQLPTSYLTQPNSPITAIIICGSAILPLAEAVFSALEANPSLTKYLVISGGIGHSTTYLYQAVRNHVMYRPLSNMIDGMPEARVLELIMERYYAVRSMEGEGLKVLIDDRSTNCGANAIESRRVLNAAGMTRPDKLVVVQDPTMSLRTVAAFEKVYEDVGGVNIKACPVFVPKVKLEDGGLVWNIPGLKAESLWAMNRFVDLVMGEVPRLRDDENGYGPKGRWFIAHVDIPEEVESAYASLKEVMQHTR